MTVYVRGVAVAHGNDVISCGIAASRFATIYPELDRVRTKCFRARLDVRQQARSDAGEGRLRPPLGIPRLVVLLGFLALILSIAAAPAAYALGPTVSIAVDGSIDGQAAYLSGGADGVPSDKGKFCPYRHCAWHAHYATAIVLQPSEAAPESNAAARVVMRTSMRASVCSAPALRPPQAWPSDPFAARIRNHLSG